VKKVLVTGGAGYLGKHLAKTLYKAGHEVYCVDRVKANCKYYHKELQSDIAEFPKSLYQFFIEDINTVFHLAGRIEVGMSWNYPIHFWKDNVLATLHLIDMMKEYKIPNIVYSSSAGVYKPKENLLTENDPISYNNPYANSKIAAENAIRDSGINHTIFRFFNLAGADPDGEMGEDHQPETHMIPLLFENLNNFVINGNDYQTKDGTCIRDYVHVSDVAEAHLSAMNYLNTWKSNQSATLNLGTGVGYSNLEIVNLAKDKLGIDIQYKFGPRRQGDPSRLVADIESAKSLLDFKPKYDISDILETAYSWYTRNEHR